MAATWRRRGSGTVFFPPQQQRFGTTSVRRPIRHAVQVREDGTA